MFLCFINKKLFAGFLFLLMLAPNVSNIVYANEVSVLVSGKTITDALEAALRIASRRHIQVSSRVKNPILEEEVLSNSSQYIASYKVSDTNSSNTWVNINANVDLTALSSIYALTPSFLGKKKLKIQILMRGLKNSAPWLGVPYSEADSLLLEGVTAATYSRFLRRRFEILPALLEYQDFLGNFKTEIKAGLRTLALRTSADMVLLVDVKLKNAPDEKGRMRGLRLFHIITLYDSLSDTVVGKNSGSLPLSVGDRAITKNNLRVMENIQTQLESVLHEMLMRAGNHYVSLQSKEKKIEIRIVSPPSYQALQAFEKGVTDFKKVDSLQLKEVSAKVFDYAIDGKISLRELKRDLRRLNLEDYTISTPPESKTEVQSDKQRIRISLVAKETENGAKE